MFNFSILIDILALLFAIALIVGVGVCTSKSLMKFFAIPLILLCIHVYGNTVQELKIGPEHIRDHLHNLGVAGLSMIVALLATLMPLQKNRPTDAS